MTRALWAVPVLASLAGLASAAQPLAYHEVRPTAHAGWTSVDARVEAVRDTVLAAQVPGAVVALHVKAGDRVAAGQELLRIDARAAQQGAAASAAQVDAALASQQVAAREYERHKHLFEKQYISQAALDRAEAQWRSTQAQVRALRAQAGAAATQSGLHVVRAPYAGVVGSVPVALGDMALPGKPLVGLYDPAALRVTGVLAQEQAIRLREGAGAQVEIAQARRQPVAALQVLPTADAQTHTVQVRATLPPGTPAAPGMFARLWLPAPGADRLLVPATAVVRRAEMTGVYVQGEGGRPQLRQVRLGPVQGDMVEVLSGVRTGERVAQEPQAAARVH